MRAHRCAYCGDALPNRGRIDRKYCRASCRTLAYRQRHSGPQRSRRDETPASQPADPRAVVVEVVLRLKQLIAVAQRELGSARRLLAQLDAVPHQGTRAQARPAHAPPEAPKPKRKEKSPPKPRPQPSAAPATDWDAEAEWFVVELQKELLQSMPAMQGSPLQSLSAQRRVFLDLVALSGAWLEAELIARGPAPMPELIEGAMTYLKDQIPKNPQYSATLAPWLQRHEQAAQQVLLILCMKKFSDPSASPLYVIVKP